MHGRNAYDYGARFYDPLLPTWDRMDPLCEKYYHISPYAYCANDPVNFIDLEGTEIINAFDQNDENVKIATKVFIDKINDLDNAIIIFAHGSENGMHLIYKDYDEVINNLSDFEDFLSTYSDVWSSRYVTGKDVSIVLFSCETGKFDSNFESFAERLSKEFTNTSIIAPSNDVTIYGNGTSKIDNGGHWNEFVNGNVVNMYSGSLLPGTVDFDNMNLWNKINIGSVFFNEDEVWDMNSELF